MQYLMLEQFLNRIGKFSPVRGPFFQSGKELEAILNNKETNGRQKALQLTDLIRHRMAKFPDLKLSILTPDVYAEKIGKSRETVLRWIKQGKVNATNLYSYSKKNNRNNRWVILEYS